MCNVHVYADGAFLSNTDLYDVLERCLQNSKAISNSQVHIFLCDSLIKCLVKVQIGYLRSQYLLLHQ